MERLAILDVVVVIIVAAFTTNLFHQSLHCFVR